MGLLDAMIYGVRDLINSAGTTMTRRSRLKVVGGSLADDDANDLTLLTIGGPATVTPQSFGAVGDGVTDDTQAVQDAIDAVIDIGRGVVYFPTGTYLISETIEIADSGVHIHGDGPSATIIKAAADFDGTSLFILGNKVSTAVVGHMSLKQMTLNAADQLISGLEVYGLRDGSALEEVYITNDITGGGYAAFPPGLVTGQAGAGTGVAASRMCEGVQFRNVFCIGGGWADAGMMLDGLFECQFIGGGVLGSSATDNTSMSGIAVGTLAECRAVTFLGIKTGNLKNTGTGSAKDNVGIRYGQWARHCKDINTTFEGITGCATYFHGSQTSGSRLPFDCHSIYPRVYQYAASGNDGVNGPAGVNRDVQYFFNPVFTFGDASDCSVNPLVAYSNTRVNARFNAVVVADGQKRNHMTLTASVDPVNLETTIVSFDAAADPTNWVDGVSSATDKRQQFYLTTTHDNSINVPRITDTAGTNLLEFTTGLIIPRVVMRNARFTRFPVIYGTTVSINVSGGAEHTFTITDGVAFAIGAPTNGIVGERIVIRMKNASGGAAGAVTWNAIYKMAAWTSPADTFSRSITFHYDGTNWYEVSRTTADIPN